MPKPERCRGKRQRARHATLAAEIMAQAGARIFQRNAKGDRQQQQRMNVLRCALSPVRRVEDCHVLLLLLLWFFALLLAPQGAHIAKRCISALLLVLRFALRNRFCRSLRSLAPSFIQARF
jgi:hypothetical protein